jgi:hypothetical protein
VRIVTRVVETPGRVERETIEERGPVSVVQESLRVQTPVFPPAPRSDRWLAGISANPFHYRESRSWGAYAGYGFRNILSLIPARLPSKSGPTVDLMSSVRGGGLEPPRLSAYAPQAS